MRAIDRDRKLYRSTGTVQVSKARRVARNFLNIVLEELDMPLREHYYYYQWIHTFRVHFTKGMPTNERWLSCCTEWNPKQQVFRVCGVVVYSGVSVGIPLVFAIDSGPSVDTLGVLPEEIGRQSLSPTFNFASFFQNRALFFAWMTQYFKYICNPDDTYLLLLLRSVWIYLVARTLYHSFTWYREDM